MNIEIERKFLVTRNAAHMEGLPALLKSCQSKKRMVQGYLHAGKPSTRVRLDLDNKVAHLCVKGKRFKENGGKPEYEYQIPYEDGLELLDMCDDRIITKVRYEWIQHTTVAMPQVTFEIDVFTSDNLKGLVVAEVEKTDNLTLDQFRSIAKPEWCQVELTGVKGWSNRRLAVEGIPKKTPKEGA